MRLSVNDTELYFDIEGAALVPEWPAMRERPVVLALHGGPGFDHAYFKPSLSALVDAAQIVYLDQRGQGRSGRVPIESCTIEQWPTTPQRCAGPHGRAWPRESCILERILAGGKGA